MPDVHLDILSRVRIASPCEVRWDEMVGDERSRHCNQCELNVYNIASMTRAEANAFLAEKIGAGERVCGQIYRRRDGTILTRDCPIGLALIRRRLLRSAARIAAAVGLASLAAVAARAAENSPGFRSFGLGNSQAVMWLQRHMPWYQPPMRLGGDFMVIPRSPAPCKPGGSAGGVAPDGTNIFLKTEPSKPTVRSSKQTE